MLERTHRLPPATARRSAPRPHLARRHAHRRLCLAASAENWREVMRDPSVLDPEDPRLSAKPRTTTRRPRSPTPKPLQQTLFAEMKGRIKEDDSSVPSPTALRLLRPLSGGRAASDVCRQPRDGGADELLLDGDALADGKAFFQLGDTEHSPDHRLLAWSCDDSRLRALHRAGARHRHRRRSCRHRARSIRLGGLDRGRLGFLLCAARREPPAVAGLSPSARHAGERRRARLSRRTTAVFRVPVGPRSRGRFARHLGARSRDLGMLADRSSRSGRRAAAGRARAKPSVQYEVEHHPALNGEDGAGDPHQCRRRRRFQDRARRRSRRPTRATGAISSRIGRGVYLLGVHAVARTG